MVAVERCRWRDRLLAGTRPWMDDGWMDGRMGGWMDDGWIDR